MKGLSITENPLGLTAIRVHYTADPTKDIENPDPEIAEQARKWLERVRLIYLDPNAWAQEMEVNFFVAKGLRVFPQFTEATHCLPEIKYNRRKVIYRGWDFGWHAPVCLFAQIDSEGRLLILGELVSTEKTTSAFAQLVIQRSAEWFGQHAPGFTDFCDPAGQQVKSIENEKSEKRDVDVLTGLGIYPSFAYGWNRKDGRSLIHQLLALRTDNTPGLYVDSPHSPLLTQAFLGRYVFKEVQTTHDAKDEPDDATHPWADVMAAIRYLVVGLHRKLGIRRPQLSQEHSTLTDSWKGVHGYGTKRR